MDIPVGICPSQKAFLREQGAVQGAVPVEQGAADPLPVARDLHGIAAALAFGIAVVAARTGIPARATPARNYLPGSWTGI